MPARRSVIALIVAAAVIAVPVVIAAPASAAGPDSTAILGPVTFTDPSDERGPLTATVECGTAATNGMFEYRNLTAGDDGRYFVALDVNQQGVFSQDPTDNIGDPGDVVEVWLQCYGGPGGATLLATSATQTVTLTDLGATIATPDVEVDQPIVVTGSCGTVEVDWAYLILQYPGITVEADLLFASVAVGADGLYSFAVASAASAGFGVGTGFAQVICGFGPTPVPPAFPDEELWSTARATSFDVLPKALTATGAALPTGAIAIALLALGGGLALIGARVATGRRR